MEEKQNVFDFCIHVLCMFGFTMIFLMVFSLLVGEETKEISSMFALGKEGVSVYTMAQFLLISAIITGLRYFFFHLLPKAMPDILRIILMLMSIVATIAIFAHLFNWFPIDEWKPWVAFFICFAICFIVSMAVMMLKVSMENKKMEEGLAKLKKQWEEEENDKQV